MELNQFDSYKKLDDLLKSKWKNEINYIEDFFEKKKEIEFNKVYFLSLLRDKQVENLKKKIQRYSQKSIDYEKQIEFQFKDIQISKSKYDSLLNDELKNFKEKIKNQTKKIENKISNKILKWNELIDLKRTKEKNKIKILDNKKQKNINETELKFKKLEEYFSNNRDKILKLDKVGFEKIKLKLSQTKFMKNINFINQLNEDKKIGPLSYEKKLEENNFNQKKIIEKTNRNHRTKIFSKGKRKITLNLATTFSNKKRFQNQLIFGLDQTKLIIIIMLITIVVGIMEPAFFSTRNWRLIFLQNADLACLAIGVTIIILTGGIDLSIGSTLAFASAIVARMIVDGHALYLAILALVGFCALAGLLSGVLVAWLKLPPFIVTLVMMLIWRGATYVLLDNRVVPVQNDALARIATLEPLGIPLPIIIVAVLAILTFILLQYTVYGRSIYAVGANYKASELSGIKSKLVLASVYVTASMCFAVGSLLYIARIRVATPTTGSSWELEAIACVVLGGTALTGGKGGIIQTMIGWFVMSVLKNALVIAGIDTNVQSIVKGAVILIAIVSQSNYGLIKFITKKINILKYKIMTL